MNSSGNAILFAPILLAVSVSGCHPGYRYQPVDAKGAKLQQWSQTVEGVRFCAKPYTTLSGSGNTVVYLDIGNESDKEVVVCGGQLLTNGRTIDAKIYDSPEGREARSVSPGTSKAVMLYWDFGGAASDVLGPSITWVWHVQIGDKEHNIRVPMQR